MIRDIGVNTGLAAIIGTDIGHSKSPAMMNAAFQKLDMDAYYYAMNIKEEDFGTVLRALPKMNFIGLTITIPYKIEVMQYLDEIDPLAEIIGAVNTIRIRDGRMKGFNTDGEGFVRGLEKDLGVDTAESTFLVIGAGGVSRAIMTVLASRKAGAANPGRIYLANRTVEKARALCDKLNAQVCSCCVPIGLEDIPEYIREADVLVNATNVGMPPMEGRAPLDLSLLRSDLVVADVIYNPEKTALLQEAERLGCRWVNGKSLLIHQGCMAFGIFTDREAPAEDMRKAVFGH